MIKQCTICMLEKDISEFNKHPSCKYGVNSVCKICGNLKASLYRKNNLEKRKEYQRNYYLTNKEKCNNSSQKWIEENHSHWKEHQKIYSKTLKGSYVSSKAHAKRRNILFEITLDYFSLFKDCPCFYCGKPLEKISLDRINNFLGYIEGNVVTCCSVCNEIKMDRDLFELKEHLVQMLSRVTIWSP